MNTKLEVIHFSPNLSSEFIRLKDLFPDPELLKILHISKPPKEVLKEVIPNYELHTYLDVRPWTISMDKRKYFVRISESPYSANDSLETLSQYKRKSRDKFEKKKLIEIIHSQIYLDIFSIEDSQIKAYADILEVLGDNMSEKQIRDIISEKEEKNYQQSRREYIRRVEDENFLRNHPF